MSSSPKMSGGLTFVTWSLLLAAVSEVFGQPERLIVGKRRDAAVVSARAALYLIVSCQLPEVRDVEVGRFCARDSGSVGYLRRRAQVWFEVDREFRRLTQAALVRFLDARKERDRDCAERMHPQDVAQLRAEMAQMREEMGVSA